MPEQVSLGSFLSYLLSFFGGGAYSAPAFAEASRIAANIWLAITIFGYLIAFAGIGVIAYVTMRLFDLRKREEEFYGTLLVAPEREQQASPRWQHITTLLASGNPSELREAILEADIMLDDLLSRQGYAGEGVAEKLQQVEASDMATLQDAWEAHRVRNQVAHQGSAFDLSPTLAQRTLMRYERVFREFNII